MRAPTDDPPPSRASRAAVFTLLSRLIRSGGKMLAFLLVARSFPLDDTGDFAYLVVIGSLAGTISDFGLSEYVLREIPLGRFRARELLSRAAAIRLVGLIPATVGAWGVVMLLTRREIDWPSLLTVAFGCAGSATEFVGSARRVLGRFGAETIESVAGIGLPLLIATIAAASGASFEEVQVVLGGAAVAIAVGRLLPLARRPEGHDRGTPAASLVWHGRWFLAKAVVAWAVFESAIVYVDGLATAEQVALFASALRPAGLITHPFLALSWAFMPPLAHEYARSRDRFLVMVRRLNRVILAFTPAVLTGGLLLGQLLLRAFGESYLRSAPQLLLLSIAYTIYFGPISGLPLLTLRRERIVVLSSICSFATQLVVSLALVPTSGALGAAIAVLAGVCAAKIIHIAVYRAEKLPIIERHDALGMASIIVWLSVALVTPPAVSTIVLLAGAIVSVALTWHLLRGTILFRGGSDPGSN
jgi:O-antigen/teichoic acid export membrane protein